ncbi:acetyl-CoA synthetase-like protein [Phanerochaete sordida]|uniref:Acetyl-CoA synthetase-like protein n=1 Tax=Phanerochaete sordida TaxID=48140 RepID=A0A9P3G2D2_9APHY|nr:acetyl-CoA synthetase-like protein [Phanerochaete sordida]
MMGRFPAKPSKDQQLLLDLVKPDLDTPRTLWKTKLTNPELRRRVSALGTAFVQVAGLTPGESNVLLLLNDSLEFVLSDLALSAYSIPSFTLTSISLLSPVLETHPPSAIITEAEFLPQLLELIYDTNEGSHHTVIVVGEPNVKNVQGLNQVRVIKFSDLEKEGAQLDQLAPSATDPLQVFTVSFYETPSGDLRGAQFTHENITAGVTAMRALMPTSGPISPLDTVVSAHSLSSGYGRAVAYTAIFEGANFVTTSSSKLVQVDSVAGQDLNDLTSVEQHPIPSPTILFVSPAHLTTLSSAIIENAKKASTVLYSLAWRHKLAGVLEGFFTKQSLWDRLVFDGARMQVMGKGAGTVRALVVSEGPVENQALTPARVAMSVPIVLVHSHPQVSGPVLATHPLDVQSFPADSASPGASAADNYTFSYLATVGAPTINVEAKLKGVDDDSVEDGGDPAGHLYLRGPSVGVVLGWEPEEGELEKGWIESGERAKVLPNGSFKVVSSRK